MDYETIYNKIKACKDDLDLFDVRAELNRYKCTSGNPQAYVILHLMYDVMSRRIAKKKTKNPFQA